MEIQEAVVQVRERTSKKKAFTAWTKNEQRKG